MVVVQAQLLQVQALLVYQIVVEAVEAVNLWLLIRAQRVGRALSS
jgi:hypothetical protein